MHKRKLNSLIPLRMKVSIAIRTVHYCESHAKSHSRTSVEFLSPFIQSIEAEQSYRENAVWMESKSKNQITGQPCPAYRWRWHFAYDPTSWAEAQRCWHHKCQFLLCGHSCEGKQLWKTKHIHKVRQNYWSGIDVPQREDKVHRQCFFHTSGGQISYLK